MKLAQINIHTKIIVLLIAAIFTTKIIYAQDTLTLELCRQKALQYNKEIKSAEFQKLEAESYRDAARTAYYPSLSADLSLTHVRDIGNIESSGGFLPTAISEEAALNGEFSGLSDIYSPGLKLELDNITLINGGLSLTQPIYAGGKIRYTNKKAGLGVEMADMGIGLKKSEIIEKTDQAFWNIAIINTKNELVAKHIEMLTELEEKMNDMFEIGLTPASETLKVTVQKNEAELQMLKVKNGLIIAKMYLNQLIGNELNQEFNITYNDFNAEVLDVENGSTMALSNRKELMILENKVDMTVYDMKLARADYLPQLGLGIQYTGIHVDDLLEFEKFRPMIAAQLTIPLFSWGQGKHKQKAASYKVKQAETNLQNSKELINLEVQQVRIKISEASEEIEIAQKNVTATKENLQETSASFDAGLNTTTELLNAQAKWINATSRFVSAQAKYKLLETTWARVTGKL